MSYDAWNPAPDPLDKPSVRTFDDWVYELTDSDYLEVLNGLYDADEIETWKQVFFYIKTLLGKGEDCKVYDKFYAEIKSLLEEWYKTDFYDDINYVW